MTLDEKRRPSGRQTRANNAVLTLGAAGDIVILCDIPGSGTVQVILDVNGCFE